MEGLSYKLVTVTRHFC